MPNLLRAASVLDGSRVVVLERAIILELTCHTNHRQGNIIQYRQNHNPKDFEVDECLETCDKNIAETLESLISKHT